MYRRRLIATTIFVTLALPVGALADDASSLGPSSTSPSAGGSSADATALQPAGLSIQSPSGSSTGLSASNNDASTLQQPATASNNQLQVLVSGDADGGTSTADASHSAWWYASWIILALALLSVLIAVLRWRNRRSERAFLGHSSVGPIEEMESQSPTSSNTDEIEKNEPTEPNTAPQQRQSVQKSKKRPQKARKKSKKTGDGRG